MFSFLFLAFIGITVSLFNFALPRYLTLDNDIVHGHIKICYKDNVCENNTYTFNDYYQFLNISCCLWNNVNNIKHLEYMIDGPSIVILDRFQVIFGILSVKVLFLVALTILTCYIIKKYHIIVKFFSLILIVFLTMAIMISINNYNSPTNLLKMTVNSKIYDIAGKTTYSSNSNCYGTNMFTDQFNLALVLQDLPKGIAIQTVYNECRINSRLLPSMIIDIIMTALTITGYFIMFMVNIKSLVHCLE